MGERELREKYGGKLPKALNRAIREEIPEGNAALDRLAALSGPAAHSGWKERNGTPTPEAAAYFKHQQEVVGPMETEIRRKYDIPSEKPKPANPKKRAPRRRSS